MKPSSDEATIEHRHRNSVSAAPCRKPLGARCRPTRLGSLSRMIENFRSKLRKKLVEPEHGRPGQVQTRAELKIQGGRDSATGCGGWGGCWKEVIY